VTFIIATFDGINVTNERGCVKTAKSGHSDKVVEATKGNKTLESTNEVLVLFDVCGSSSREVAFRMILFGHWR
jgi:hypothetical protein